MRLFVTNNQKLQVAKSWYAVKGAYYGMDRNIVDSGVRSHCFRRSGHLGRPQA